MNFRVAVFLHDGFEWFLLRRGGRVLLGAAGVGGRAHQAEHDRQHKQSVVESEQDNQEKHLSSKLIHICFFASELSTLKNTVKT